MIYIIFMLLQTVMVLWFTTENIQNKPILMNKHSSDLAAKPRREIIGLCVFSAIYLFVIGAFRSSIVGYDSGQYQRRFSDIAKMSWDEVFKKYPINNEPFFYWFCKLISVFSSAPQMLFIVTGLIYAVATTCFIYNNSTNPAISFVMLFPMQFYSFLLTGMRQALAFSFVLIFYVLAKKKGRKIIYLLGVLIAFLFHKSSIAALPIIFISDKNVSARQRIIWFAILPIVYIFGASILNVLKDFLYSEYVISNEAAGTFMTMLMYFVIWAFYAFFTQSKTKREKGENQIERLLMIGIMLQLLVPYQPNFFRVAMFYQIFSLFAVPKIVDAQMGESKKIIVLCFIGIIFLLFLGFTYFSCGINPFEFFWE